MNSIDRHIEYLLIEHDCVIVPGLGAFIAHYQPARIEDGKFIPPSRSVGFNSEINHNDGLLATSIARQEKITYGNACDALATGVASLRHQLELDKEFCISRVGRLVLEPEGNIRFIPDSYPVTDLAYSAFPAVPAHAVSAEKESDSTLTDPLIKPKTPHPRLFKTAIRVAASVAILIALGFIGTVPGLFDRSMGQQASLAPDASAVACSSLMATRQSSVEEAQVYHQPAEVRFFLITPDVEGRGIETIDTLKVNKYQTRTLRNTSKQQAVENAGKEDAYCVVVASLTTKKQAKKFINTSGNPSLKILHQDGRYRVYIATAPTEDEAKAIAASSNIQRAYPGAWVTKR